MKYELNKISISNRQKLQVSDYDFSLPEGLIANYPASERTGSRLLCLDRKTGCCSHQQFLDIQNKINPGDLLVFNDTKVIPARLFGEKLTGGKVEILIERIVDTTTILAHVRASKAPKPGTEILLEGGYRIRFSERQGDLFVLSSFSDSILDMIEKVGHMPLPPYIARGDEQLDETRYQTVYAKHQGAVAAPTAGLHFDQTLLDNIVQKGINICFVTLHVGAGTFQPVRVDNILEHKMHKEYLEISPAVCERIRQTKADGKRVIAVGTTSVRVLETAAQSGQVNPFVGDTDIFIYPGYEFNCVDGLLTNFHLPQSTLLMLVCAFAGYDAVMAAYQSAIAEQYRFYSYGDAMLIL